MWNFQQRKRCSTLHRLSPRERLALHVSSGITSLLSLVLFLVGVFRLGLPVLELLLSGLVAIPVLALLAAFIGWRLRH